MLEFKDKFRQAEYWEKFGTSNNVRCTLCPRMCLIKADSYGYCKARYNHSGTLYSLVYGYPIALQIDPIEKKPFAEFLPSTWTFSIGTYGCNLGCLFCQNYHLSRGTPDLGQSPDKFIAPETIVDFAIRNKCKSIAFTYNEPSVWFEYARDIAIESKNNNLDIVLISNGYINPNPADEFYSLIDAANIDMKGFSEDFYEKMTDSHLKPVLKSIEMLYLKGKHIELTNLVIPGKNDSKEMIKNYLDWVEEKLDTTIPLHFSAYRPMYKYDESPVTPCSTLFDIREYAENRGFTSVYLGNI